MAEGSQPASIRDVARLAGVSHQTVSRVINGHPSLRPETRDRVQEAIEHLRYRPNRVAQALGSSRPHSIGVLASGRNLYGPAAAVIGVERAAYQAGLTVHTVDLPEPEGADAKGRSEIATETVEAALQLLVERRIGGLVVVAPDAPVTAALAAEPSLPYVLLQSGPAGASRSVWVDHEAGARAAVRHLVDLGHRRIGHVAGPQGWTEARDRLRGWRTELAAAGLTADEPLQSDWSADGGYAAGRQLLERDWTAVFCSNDQLALGVLHALAEAGVAVPAEVSVVGFDDTPESAHFLPPLTTVRQDLDALGRRAVGLLLDPDQPPVPSPTPALVVRASTAEVRVRPA